MELERVPDGTGGEFLMELEERVPNGKTPCGLSVTNLKANFLVVSGIILVYRHT